MISNPNPKQKSEVKDVVSSYSKIDGECWDKKQRYEEHGFRSEFTLLGKVRGYGGILVGQEDKQSPE